MRVIGHRRTKVYDQEMRSALEARWAIFFRELGLKWRYEPLPPLRSKGRSYTPDFHIEGFGYVEIKPTLDLFIEETSDRIAAIAEANPNISIYGFLADRVEIGQTVLYKDNKMFVPTPRQIYRLLFNSMEVWNNFSSEVQDSMIRRATLIANSTKFDPWRDMKDVVMDVINGLQKPYENPA